MHKIFGKKENEHYLDREGAYLIPIKNGKVGLIQTPKGYFLLGGGIDAGESEEMCIKRECLEEIGYTIRIDKKICSAETYAIHSTIGYFHPIQAYYIGELLKKVQEPIEKDHSFLWLDCEFAKENMFSKMQCWAIAQALEKLK